MASHKNWRFSYAVAALCISYSPAAASKAQERNAAVSTGPMIDHRLADAAAVRVQRFFGQPFAKSYAVEIVSNRAAFNRAVKPYGIDESQCWMVGMGVAERLVLLAPTSWKTDACDHDPADTAAIDQLVTHEMTHVFHGQHNPHGDFAGEDELGWWIEGLAALVANQFTDARRRQVREAIHAGVAPEHLADFWTGKMRYAWAGSMAEYIDHRWGREMTVQLLSASSNAEALRILGLEESQLLSDWKRSIE